MRVGIFLPQIGPAATKEAIVTAAQRAEALGYDSVWATDRLLYPVAPQTPYAASGDGSLPAAYKRVLDPVGTLTFAAAHTGRVALGTSVLDMPYYNPVTLARQLTTLDVFSGGRLRAGFGQGWSKDEFDATGASMKDRGPRADEFLAVLKAIWTTNPAEFHGKYFELPKSIIDLKPVQKPHPPIYLAAYVPGALRRAALMANGWMPVGIPIEGMQAMLGQMREMARAAGRDADALELIVRANIYVTPQPIRENRWIFSGTWDQIKEDVARTRELGASELQVDPTFSAEGETLEGFLGTMERLRTLV